MDKIQALQELTLFHEIDPSVLEPLAGYFIPRRFERGDRLWREGTDAVNFTFLVEGRVKVVKYLNDGGETILGVFGPDEVVGQLAVYNQIPYPASAYALDDTYILSIHRSHFFGTLREHPELVERMLENMMRRNHELVRRLHELSVCSAEQRLAMLFLKFGESVGKRVRAENGEMEVYIDLPLSRSDIADLINVRVETAIRFMSRWNKEGPVRTEDRGFTIVDYDRLDEIAMSIC